MTALLDRLDLRGITGPTATLVPTGRGWVYSDSDRTYSLEEDREAPAGGVRGVLEVHASGKYWIAWGSWIVGICRAEVARALAGANRDLEAAIRRDLWRFAYAVRFSSLDVAVLAGLPDDPEAPPPEEGARPDILVRGLSPRARGAVARIAETDGAEVLIAEEAAL